jgi:hypothetical protein
VALNVTHLGSLAVAGSGAGPNQHDLTLAQALPAGSVLVLYGGIIADTAPYQCSVTDGPNWILQTFPTPFLIKENADPLSIGATISFFVAAVGAATQLDTVRIMEQDGADFLVESSVGTPPTQQYALVVVAYAITGDAPALEGAFGPKPPVRPSDSGGVVFKIRPELWWAEVNAGDSPGISGLTWELQFVDDPAEDRLFLAGTLWRRGPDAAAAGTLTEQNTGWTTVDGRFGTDPASLADLTGWTSVHVASHFGPPVANPGAPITPGAGSTQTPILTVARWLAFTPTQTTSGGGGGGTDVCQVDTTINTVFQNTVDPVDFTLYSSTDHTTPTPGETVTVTITQNGNQFTGGGTVTDNGDGTYSYEPLPGEISDTGSVVYQFAGSSGVDTTIVVNNVVGLSGSCTFPAGDGAGVRRVSSREDATGDLRMIHAELNLGTYHTGGVVVDPRSFGWSGPLENVWVPPAEGLLFEYERATMKLKAICLASGTEIDDLSDLSGFSVFPVFTLG